MAYRCSRSSSVFLGGGQLGVGLDGTLGSSWQTELGCRCECGFRGRNKQEQPERPERPGYVSRRRIQIRSRETRNGRPRGAAPWSFRSEWGLTQVDGRLLTGHGLSSARKAELDGGQGLLGEL